jgi:hypothetical protein
MMADTGIGRILPTEVISPIQSYDLGTAPNLICICGFLFVVGMIGLIWWQWRAKNPIMNLPLP